MKIAIGGMQKNLMEQEIKTDCPDAETIVTNDMNAAYMMKKGEVDYYIGACESGSGSAISILIDVYKRQYWHCGIAGCGCESVSDCQCGDQSKEKISGTSGKR